MGFFLHVRVTGDSLGFKQRDAVSIRLDPIWSDTDLYNLTLKATNTAPSELNKELKHTLHKNISNSFFTLTPPAPKVGQKSSSFSTESISIKLLLIHPLICGAVLPTCILLHTSNHTRSTLTSPASRWCNGTLPNGSRDHPWQHHAALVNLLLISFYDN